MDKIIKNAPENSWFTQKGETKFRLFSKHLYLTKEEDADKYDIWTDEEKKEYQSTHKGFGNLFNRLNKTKDKDN